MPSLFDYTGTPGQGQSMTLSGTGFGAPAQIISWDDFESGVSGNTIHNVSPVIGPNWTNMVPNNPARYSDMRSYSGGTAALINWETYSICAFGCTNLGALPDVYMTFWRYHDPSTSAFNPMTVNHKLAYFYGPANDLNQWLPFMIPAGTPNWASQLQNQPGRIYYWGGPTYSGTIYNWGRWETYIQYDTTETSDDGYVENWYNGTKYTEAYNQNLDDVAGGNAVEDIRIGHMFQGYGDYEYVRSFIDDVYIATSRARLELGNAPVFGDCTLREIQIPTSWTDNTIDFDLSYSGFAQGSDAYLFVVDAAGEPSQAIHVVLGGDDPNPVILNVLQPSAAWGSSSVSTSTVGISGTASSNVGMDRITWATDTGASGVASGASNWSATVPLAEGDNTVTITAYDIATNSRTVQIFVNSASQADAPGPPGQPVRN